MIIGIDGNEANVANKVGISEYAYELLKQFANIQYPLQLRSPRFSRGSGQAISNIQFQIYLKEQPRVVMPQEADNWQYVKVVAGT